MVISVTLMSMLTLAMVDAFQGFGKQLEVLRESEEELRVEEGLVQLTHDLRNAWVVEEPSTGHLNVSDPYGRVTEYWLDGDALKVKRPSGAVGVLVAGIGALSLSTQTVERLRPDTPATLSGKWWDQAALPAADQMISVEEDLPVSLGFTVSGDAPDAADLVAGVEEQVIQVGLERLKLVAAFAAPIEIYDDEVDDGGDSVACTSCLSDCEKSNKNKKSWKKKDCNQVCDSDCNSNNGNNGNGNNGNGNAKGNNGKGHSNFGNNGNNSNGWGGGNNNNGWGNGNNNNGNNGGGCKPKGSNNSKVTICHKSKCKPGKGNTIEVSSSAQAAHLAHGDTLGACGSSGGGGNTTPVPYPAPAESDLVVELYEARAPNSGVPYGPVLGSVTIPVAGLPAGTFTWTEVVNTKAPTKGDSKGCSKGGSKTVICHVPPGNPGNSHTLSVGNKAVAAHLAHGDSLGTCGTSENTDDSPVIVFDQPASLVEIDLSSMNALIEPGRAHTLVLRLEGSGSLLLASDPITDSVYSGVAQIESEAELYSPLAHSVARSLEGSIQVTQTQAQDVISRVTLNLETSGGNKLSRSAAVLGQNAIENPWLGAVPGELPTLDLVGQ
ncbi:MAG: hypothetical protein DHS20C15_26500 [Planctomycetota bacterium]|nr:MAG: hypothetical protein DHS20C15_26500 [Planctomycetota bacterium]